MCFDETLDRRAFLKFSSIGLSTILAGSFALPGISFAATPGGKTLIKIFMRGGADTLFMFPQYADLNYYRRRPTVKIEPPNGSDSKSAVALTNALGLHPMLRPLKEIWDSGTMAVYPATHFNEGNFSHFDCQAWIERGAQSNTIDGVFNRYLQQVPGDHALRALVAGMSTTADSMVGDAVVPSVPSGSEFGLTNWNWCDNKGYDWNKGSCIGENLLQTKLAELNAQPQAQPTMEMTRRSQQAILSVVDQVKTVSTDYVPSAGGLTYSKSTLGKGLELVAQLLKADVPVEIAAVDWNNGWDSHEDHMRPGTDPTDVNNRYAAGLQQGANDMLCFFRDLGAKMQDVIVLVGSEFGREIQQNGTYGTDHGRGGAWFAFGGSTKPGVFGMAPSLAEADSYRERYMQSVINYKDITAEAMVRHLGMSETLVASMFPRHTFTNNQLFVRS
jgi:uncharacterized protein (DUF1501 family)